MNSRILMEILRRIEKQKNTKCKYISGILLDGFTTADKYAWMGCYMPLRFESPFEQLRRENRELKEKLRRVKKHVEETKRVLQLLRAAK